MMLRRIACFLFVLGWTISGAGWALGAGKGKTKNTPRLEVKSASYDFGKVMAGKNISSAIELTNAGTAPLTIEEVRTSCGCTVTKSYSRVLQPGKSGTIPYELRTNSLDGKVAKTIWLFTNDPERQKLKYVVRGTVWQPILVEPRSANFGVLSSPHKGRTMSLRLIGQLPEPFEVTRVRSSSKNFSGRVKTVSAGKEYTLIVEAKPPFPYGSTLGMISVETTCPARPLLNISAFAYLPEPLEVSPKVLLLPNDPLPNLMTRGIVVMTHKSGELHLADIKINGAPLKWRLQDDLDGRRYRILIDFPKGFDVNTTPAQLTFKTNMAGYETVTVEIKSYLAPRTNQKK